MSLKYIYNNIIRYEGMNKGINEVRDRYEGEYNVQGEK